MRRARGPRLARAVVASSIATFTALVSHVAAGAAMPAWIAVVLPFALSLLVCTALAGRRLSLWRMSLAVILSQVLFHTLFELGTFAPSITSDGSPGAHHHAVGLTALATAGTPAPIIASGTAMLAGHAVAALLTIAALYRGERSVLHLLHLARSLAVDARERVDGLIAGCMTAVPARPRRFVVRTLRIDANAVSVVLSPLQRRGPPVAFVL